MENKDGRQDHLALTPADHAFIMTKNRANRLGFAVLLAFFRSRGRFPRAESEIERSGMEELGDLLNTALPQRNGLVLSGRTAERHRGEIRAYLGFHEATVADAEMLTAWLSDRAASMGGVPEHLAVVLDERCRELLIEPPSTERSDRIVRAAIHAHDCGSAWLNRSAGRSSCRIFPALPTGPARWQGLADRDRRVNGLAMQALFRVPL